MVKTRRGRMAAKEEQPPPQKLSGARLAAIRLANEMEAEERERERALPQPAAHPRVSFAAAPAAGTSSEAQQAAQRLLGRKQRLRQEGASVRVRRLLSRMVAGGLLGEAEAWRACRMADEQPELVRYHGARGSCAESARRQPKKAGPWRAPTPPTAPGAQEDDVHQAVEGRGGSLRLAAQAITQLLQE